MVPTDHLARRSLLLSVLVVAACSDTTAPTDVVDPVVYEIDWDTPLTEDWIGMEVGDDIRDHTLRDIISGRVAARGAGRTCSACHFDQSVTLYRPEFPPYAVDDIEPYDILDGRTWAGRLGWGTIFAAQNGTGYVEKPPELREALRLWVIAESARVEPLHWTDPVTRENVGGEPDPNIAGRSLDDVLNSRVTGRPDNLLCSECHYTDGPFPYRPEIAQGSQSAFGPDDLLDGRSWAGATGWAMVFAELGGNDTFHKPDYLRATFFKWYDDGNN